MSVEPFKINIPQAKLDRLKQKLAAADFPDELDDSGWSYGAPLADVRRLAEYWHDEFDWRKAEAELNEIPQFTATIKIENFDATVLHFVHAKSPNPGAIPLLFAHGWPGSFDEVAKILPLLLDGGKDHPSFDVVAPSMPNYAFSAHVRKKGFAARQVAEMFHKLMTETLRYPEYVTQGGDVGYRVTRYLGLLYPGAVKASHYNMPRPEAPTPDKFPELYEQDQQTPLTDLERKNSERADWFQREGMGYFKEQATKPQTLGYSLADSPVGMLAWIYEKLHDWADNYPWTDYEICKWISIYWFSTAGPAASIRIYYENTHSTDPYAATTLSGYLEGIKIGVTQFPKELSVPRASWCQTLGDLVFYRAHDSGGHFAAFERPDELANDLREMFGKGGGAYAVVKDRLGHA